MPRLNDVEELLPAFADPAFQILLRKAQQAAASSEREDDYELLSQLLVCHVQKGSDRKNRSGIRRAIEIIDQIDNDALCALTVAHAVSSFLPGSGNCIEGLQVLNSLFDELMYQELPIGGAWLDHLDILGAIRLSSIGKMKKFSDYYSSELEGYACVGIKVNSEEYKQAVELLKEAKIGSNFLVPNECLDGYVRLGITQYSQIEELGFENEGTRHPLSSNQKDIIKQIWKMYSTDTTLQQKVVTKFVELWDSFNNLQKLRIWWESIPHAFEITQVGKIIAHTNAKRCSTNVPDLI